MPAEQTTAVALLAERLSIAPASCMAHYAILRTRLADLADENGIRGVREPAALTVADIARLLDEVNESIDPSALDEAVRSGACALVDFKTAVADARFYSGVDALPTGVGAPTSSAEEERLSRGQGRECVLAPASVRECLWRVSGPRGSLDVADDEARHLEAGEPSLDLVGAALLEPARLFVGTYDDHDLIGFEVAQRVLRGE